MLEGGSFACDVMWWGVGRRVGAGYGAALTLRYLTALSLIPWPTLRGTFTTTQLIKGR